jgi:uncharacterized protein (TIGR03067 family)
LWISIFAASLAALLQAASPAVGQEQPAVSDDQRILGSWKSTRFERDGKTDPTGSGGKAVFTKGHCVLHGLPSNFALDATQSPKHFEWGTNKGIYEFKGDWLRICFASSSRDPRPLEFKTAQGDGRQLLIFKRLAALDARTPDADFDPALKKAITGAVAALEKGDVDTFLKVIIPPGELEKLPKARLDGMVKHISPQTQAYLITFKTLLKIKPEINSAGTAATFNLTNFHIEGGLPMGEAKFAKSAGNWHLLGP